MWRVVMYMFVPVAFVVGAGLSAAGHADDVRERGQVATLEPGAMGTTDEGQAKPQTIVVGPVAALCRSSNWAPTAADSTE